MQVATAPIRWQDRAACAGMEAALWFPEKSRGRPPKGVDPEDNHGREAKAICAACPVVVDCLEHALAKREKDGILGGASPRRRRVLIVAYLQRDHDFDANCRNESCRWCPVVREHLARLAGLAEGPVVLNGPNARCGYRSTYARGCRCGPCSLAISTVGMALADTGVELAAWWTVRFGARTDIALIDMAKWYAELELSAAA